MMALQLLLFSFFEAAVTVFRYGANGGNKSLQFPVNGD